MAIFLPGSAHFLAGQRRTGVCWFFALFLLPNLWAFPASAPGVGPFYITIVLSVIGILLFVLLLISSWRPTRRMGCLGWLLFVGTILLMGKVVNEPCKRLHKTYVGEAFVINGAAMAPTMIVPSESAPEVLRPDRVVASKWLYRVSDPKRGDIVIHNATNKDGLPTIWTHRVVGLPGETVDIEPPYVLINGERLTEPPIFAKISARKDGFSGYCRAEEVGGEGVSLPLTLGSDEYFLLGDNSPHSLDSRFVGPVLRQNITGRIIRIYFPLDRIRELE